MELRSIFASSPARGWLPWGLLAPIVCLALAIATQLPTELLLERLGFIDGNGDTIGTTGFMAFLLAPFSVWGLVVLAWVLLIERRTLATIGLTKPGGAKTVFGGLLIGVATISAVVFMIWLAGAYQAQRLVPAFADPGGLLSIAILLACFALQSSVEEIIFRGWLLSVITRRMNLVFAVLLSSALFTLLHFTPGQPLLVTGNLVLFSVFACFWAIASNNVWGVMGWHAGWNWMLATGFEVPVTGIDAHVPALAVTLAPIGSDFLTGGAQGPEGSIMCTLFFVCGIVFFGWRISKNPERRRSQHGAAY